jgi:hypothetical protein
MYQDAKARGKSTAYVLPYLAVTAIFVSIGPLLYIIVKVVSKEGVPANA